MKTQFNKWPLDERVLDQLSKIGFKRPTLVQEEVIPQILNRRNLIVEAATGTGKTAAYGLPVLSKLNFQKRSIQALVLVPSRELAIQVESALKTYTSNEHLKVGAIYGGSTMGESEAMIKSCPHVLIAVPGRLRDVLREDKFNWFWRDIQYLVIDEADKLLESGFTHELDVLLANLRKKAQVTLFSATISEDIEAIIQERFKNTTTIRLSPKEALRNIDFWYINVQDGANERYLATLLKERKISSALIFCNKREEVLGLAGFLRSAGWQAEAYHGLLDQVERESILTRFRKKQVRFLIATDLAARGLDIAKLPAVINFSFPENLEVYLHRTGRTGRAGEHGACFNLVSSKEEEIHIQGFHKELNVRLTEMKLDPAEKVSKDKVKLVKIHLNRGKKDKILKGDVVGFLLNLTEIQAYEIGTISIYDDYVTVDIPDQSIKALINPEEKLKIKGKSVVVRKYALDEQRKRAKKVQKRVIGSREREAQKKRRG
ncbi:MAG: DEAD/DEAH box helicase [Bacteroidia bacterium]|nr:DEAD/DEAH box helicase [Bacteroidia bacterium]